MKRYGIRLLALLIVFSLLVPSLEFPSPANGAQAESFIRIEEGKLDESLIEELLVSEEFLSQQYIREHLIYEDDIYEYRIDEDIIAQAYVFETKVSVNTTSEMVEILPRQIDDYEIDWPAVIGKFAVGTAIIITVGVVHHFTKGVSSYFIMATPAQVAKDAFVGGAIGAALNMVIHDILNGKTVEAGAIKYAIEGCYVVPLCQGVQQIFNIELTLDDQKEHQAKQTPALATLLYVDWDNQRKSDTDRSMVRRER